jgi:hypothetical protein
LRAEFKLQPPVPQKRKRKKKEKESERSHVWWCTSIIPALRRQRHEDHA